MKKILLLIFMAGLFGYASAQFTTGVKVPQLNTDTIKTGALTVTKVINLTSGYSLVSFQPVVTKVSGTIAGKVYIAGSVDGTNYILADSLVLSDVATNTKIFKFTGNPYWKYKIWGVGTGTLKGLFTLWYLARKHE